MTECKTVKHKSTVSYIEYNFLHKSVVDAYRVYTSTGGTKKKWKKLSRAHECIYMEHEWVYASRIMVLPTWFSAIMGIPSGLALFFEKNAILDSKVKAPLRLEQAINHA
jgi:hypothetical protein